MRIDNVPMEFLIPNMLQASVWVFRIFFLTILFSVPLGFLVALGRRSRFKFINVPLRIYQIIFRGTPLMIQLFFFMYAPILHIWFYPLADPLPVLSGLS